MKVLVAGGSGFIGRNIIKKFKEENYETISYDMDNSNSNADVNIKGSIMDYDELYKASRCRCHIQYGCSYNSTTV